MKNISFQEMTLDRPTRRFDIRAMVAERESERYGLHVEHMNEMMVRVLQTIGFDVAFQKGEGQYLFDRRGDRYLDLLSGWGVFGVGRNHPVLREALSSVLASDFPNLVQMDVSVLGALLAERLLGFVPFLDKVFFTNSGAETVEAAINLRAAPPGGWELFIAVMLFTAFPMARCRSMAMRFFGKGLVPSSPAASRSLSMICRP